MKSTREAAAAEPRLTGPERELLGALASAALPPGRLLPGAGERAVLGAESFVARLGATPFASWRGFLWALEAHALATQGNRFAALPIGARLAVLEAWRAGELTRLWLRALLAPLKYAHFDDREVFAALGCRWGVDAPIATETPRWMQQIADAGDLARDEALECDAVVVGTGAGGAVVAKELAEAGHAVLMLEEGAHHTRRDFTGRAVDMMRRLYRRGGLTLAYGNTVIPIPVGMTVGGTTTVNAGTCFRAPEWTLREWREKHGVDFTPEGMDPHYSRVEDVLRVAEAAPHVVGGPGRIIARGCDALGWSHRPLKRNAPDCDGQGLCCFGCPTDAKRSTNVSYVPLALERSAMLLTGVRVERVRVRGETAIGVEGRAQARDGGEVRVTVRAKVVVLAGGAFGTPLLLLRSGLANESGEVGRNLSIHPATAAMGVFDEPVNSATAIPQGYSIDQFHREGLLFEGASVPLDAQAATHTGFGPGFVELMERFDRSLSFGYMVKDTSRGRVRLGRDGEPLITYWMNDRDLAQVKRGMELLARVFFAAGAREVHPAVAGFERLRSVRELDAMASANLSPRHFDLTAWHPLGTARMGTDPLKSVVGPTHETHDVHNLFVCDGSSMPGPPGVNPQLTIMAMATRASEFVARRIERLARA